MAATQRMSSADAAWLHMDRPTNLMVITSALWFDERVDWAKAREVLRARLVEPFPRFRQRVVEGRAPLSGPHWEHDPQFDLDSHVHQVGLPHPGDRTALEQLVADLIASPLDRSKPLWHFHFIDGYGSGSAILVRMHHCIADGIALAQVLLSLTDAGHDPRFAPAGDEQPRSRGHGAAGALLAPARAVYAAARDAGEAIAHEAIKVARHPAELTDLAVAARADAQALAEMLLRGTDEPTPLKGRLGISQRVAWSAPIPLGHVKALGHRMDATVNDVLLSAMAGALRTYLRRRGGLVDAVTAFVPFNLRPLDQPLSPDLGNRFGLVFLSLPVGIGDRRRRLAEVHQRMDEIKHSPEGAVSYGLLEAIGRTPVQVEKRLVELFSAKGTAVITNVPGPRKQVHFAGSPVRGVLVWAPRSGSVAMSVAIFSYAGEITVGLMVDEGLIPDPESIVASFGREVEALARLSTA
jgi:WS/DGAT/MGAT family acyltransferase